MSIWTDIHKRSNGTSIRKEDQVIPKEHKNLQDNAPCKHIIGYDSCGKIFKTYVTDLDDMLDNFKNDYYFF